MKLGAAFLHLATSASYFSFASAAVWPTPQAITTGDDLLTISKMMAIKVSGDLASDRLNRGIARYSDLFAAAANSADDGVATITLSIISGDESLSQASSYAYNITSTSSKDEIAIDAETIYGAIYGLETLLQLANTPALPLDVVDSPRYNHRGLMVDTGRRFVPLPLMLQTIDNLAISKMNVLHLHFADWCRYAIESEKFPALNSALTGDQAGHYSVAEMDEMISYANDRGIRVIPEVDLPGHSTWGLPLMDSGDLKYCTADFPPSLLDDEQNVTQGTLKTLIDEINGVFGHQAELIHIGADETSELAAEGCTIGNIAGLESEIFAHIVSLGKIPSGWEEVLFKSGGANGFEGKAVINAWNAGPRPSDIEAKGFDAIESLSDNFYLNNLPSMSTTWADIADGDDVTADRKLLGGEVSMWTDNYCYTLQCGAFGPDQAPPVGAALYPPSMDTEFTSSFNGLVWPKAALVGGSFWNYYDMEDDEIAAVGDMLSELISSRGGDACPSEKQCEGGCDYLTRCKEEYIQNY
jgi:hexosaminidase